METNYLGSIHVTKSLIDGMISRKHGHIVFLSSIGGQVSTHKCIFMIIIYLEHACLIDRQSQLWIKKAINQACDVTCEKLVAG